MAPTRVSLSYGRYRIGPDGVSQILRNRVAQDGVVQRFQVPDIPPSLRILPAGLRHNEGFFSVRVGDIKRIFMDYDHIKRELPQNIVVPTVPQE